MEDLLKPTLSSDESGIAIYSTQANILVAFFGGPLAIILFSALNSRHLNRLKKDWPAFLVGIVATIGMLIYLMSVPDGVDIKEWVAQQKRDSLFYKYGMRILALSLWAVYYYLHRQYHKAMSIFGIDPLSPWKMAVACILAAMGINYAGTVFAAAFF